MHPILMVTLSLLAQVPSETLEAPKSTADPMKWIVPLTIAFGTMVIPYLLGFPLANYFKLKTHGWRIGLILATLATSLAVIGFYWPPKLGVDLKGGANLVYGYDLEKLKELSTGGDELYRKSKTIDILKSRLNPDGLKEIVIRPYGENAVEFVIPETNEEQIEEMKRAITSTGFMEFMVVAERGLDDVVQIAIEQNRERPSKSKLVRRDDVPIGTWRRLGLDAGKANNAEQLIPFKVTVYPSYLLRDGDTGKILDESMHDTKDEIDLERRLSRLGVKNPEVLMLYNANREQRVEGGDLRLARNDRDEFGGPAVAFELTEAGAPKMGAFTDKYKRVRETPGRQLAIVLDERVMSTAEIRSRIDNRGQITGRFTSQEVASIVNILESGSIPAPLNREPSTVTQVDPTLGMDSIRNGAIAIGVSLGVVLLFVLVYYQFAGAVACFALIFNLIITLAIMILFGAPFTMPGLAGMVLTVGMSVDSNVLIFERMREEMERGAGLRMAIRNGFDRAFITILDSNLTTLLTAAVLYFVGTDQLVGFAVTLILGIVSSMFTAIFCARVIFDIAERNGWIKELSMMKFMTKTNFDFIKWQWVAIAASVLLIGIGILAGIARGPGLFDIDFRGGTSVDISLKKPMEYAEVRERIAKVFDGQIDPRTKTPYDINVTKVKVGGVDQSSRYKIDTSMEKSQDLETLLEKAFSDNSGTMLRTYKVKFDPVAAKTPATNSQGSRTDIGPYFTAALQDAAAEAKTEEPKAEEAKAEPAEKSDGAAIGADEPKTGEAAKSADESAPATPAKTEEPAEATPKTRNVIVGDETVTTVLEINDDTGHGDGVDRDALLTMIKQASDKAINESITAEAFPVGDLKDGRSLKWRVALPLDAESANKVLGTLRENQEGQIIWPSSSTIGPQVADTTKFNAIVALIVSLLGIVGYVWFRFHQISWGIAAVVALVHDVLFMFAAIAVSSYVAQYLGFLGVEDFKINLTIVAAFLTLIGYSINDTIVIFDRLREVKGRLPDVNREIVNDSINQTLSRTLLTFLTTFIVVVILYAFGGQGIHGFAFAMLVGTAVGCYSTVYIASPVLLALVKQEDAKPVKRAA